MRDVLTRIAEIAADSLTMGNDEKNLCDVHLIKKLCLDALGESSGDVVLANFSHDGKREKWRKTVKASSVSQLTTEVYPK